MIPRLYRPAVLRVYGILLLVILIAGCGPQQVVRPVQNVAPTPSGHAETLLRSGDFSGAAAEFARLAASGDVTNASKYRAMAALAYLDAGDPQSAASLLPITADESVAVPLLDALALAAAKQDADLVTATRYIDLVDPNRLTPYQRSVYYRTLGRLSMGNRAHMGAVSAFVAADDAYALPTQSRAALHQNIWRALSHLDEAALNSARSRSTASQLGWLDLAILSMPNLHDNAALAGAIDSWRARYPQHPANTSFVEQLYEISENLSATTSHIALLLPFKGAFASAANAIRDGFVSAWYATPGTSARPTVSIYSVDASTVAAVYDIAVANGADLIVGPLEKQTVETLAARAELPVRTLALNILDKGTQPTTSNGNDGSALLFQFGLAPEDEAAAAAERAWADGHTRAVTMAPETAWGKRVAEGFAERWTALGGNLLHATTYGGADTSYAQSVKRALNLDLSEARAAQLRRALNRNLHFEPRSRDDVDAIFLASFPVSARQVLPQLRYFRAASVPVYATSHAFTGNVNTTADQDLDGLRFGDMPWLFGGADLNSFSMFKQNWPNSATGAGRLFAFGMDAYRILPYLARMRHQPGLRVPGTTGQLHMDSNGRVVRDLVWAQFSGGVPSLIRR